jgi:hypothetical protein
MSPDTVYVGGDWIASNLAAGVQTADGTLNFGRMGAPPLGPEKGAGEGDGHVCVVHFNNKRACPLLSPFTTLV